MTIDIFWIFTSNKFHILVKFLIKSVNWVGSKTIICTIILEKEQFIWKFFIISIKTQIVYKISFVRCPQRDLEIYDKKQIIEIHINLFFDIIVLGTLCLTST